MQQPIAANPVPSTLKKLDGRRQRSEASRERIVHALLKLIGAGDVSPSAESVAKQAGVGLRTVFRHFDNMESLYREIDSLITAEVLPIVEVPFAPGPWHAQLREALDRRARLFEKILPFKIAAEAHRHSSPFLERQSMSFARLQREALLNILPQDRARNADFVECLDLVFSFDAWRRLRKDQKLSPQRAREVMECLINMVLGPVDA